MQGGRWEKWENEGENWGEGGRDQRDCEMTGSREGCRWEEEDA